MKPAKSSSKLRPIMPWADDEAAALVEKIVRAVGREPSLKIPSYSISEAEGIVDTVVTGREYLQQGLQRAIAQYRFEAKWHEKASRTELTSKLQSIEKATKRIYEALGIKSTDGDVVQNIDPQDLRHSLTSQAALMAERNGGFAHYPPMTFRVQDTEATDWSPAAQLRDILTGLKQLEHWAEAARERLSLSPVPKHSERHKGDVAERRLIGDLAGLWIACYKTYPKFSRASGDSKPGGPFFKFLESCFIAAKVPFVSHEALMAKAKRTVGTQRKLLKAGHPCVPEDGEVVS